MQTSRPTAALTTGTMRALVQQQYGSPDLLELRDDVPVPAVGDGEVLVRVRASSVNPYDCVHVTGTPYLVRLMAGLRRPRQPIRGVDLAGQVEAVGPGVTRFRPGDEVFGLSSGTYADYVSTSADLLVTKPASLSFEEAAAVPLAGLTALQALRTRGRIEPGQRVLINGASGGVGTFAVQLAKAFGAEVTGVCSSRNVDTARSLGADRVIDYTREDFGADGTRYDLIVDSGGNRTVADRRRALTPEGTLVIVGGPKTNRWVGPMGDMVKVLLTGPFVRQRMTGIYVTNNRPDMELLAELLELGKLRPFVESTHPLADVPAQLAYVAEGHARGKVVITGRGGKG
jgi:NADPH:quinone reductase-like Zn-dependent oxidoreductase